MMLAKNTCKTFSEIQDDLYIKLNSYSRSQKNVGRLVAIPVTILDVALETFKTPIGAIEAAALAAINLVGAAFSEKLSLKNALSNLDFTLTRIASTPVKLTVAPLKLIYQLVASLIAPDKVQSINSERPTFKQFRFLSSSL